MTCESPNTGNWPWLLAMVAVVVAFFATLYFDLFFLFFGPFPKDVAEPTAGFLMGLLIVLAGSLFAPRYRLATAVVLCAVAVLLGTALLNLHFLGALVGGLTAVGIVAWWFHPRRTRRSAVWVGVAACVAFVMFMGVVYARHVDWPERPDELPFRLARALDDDAGRASTFYEYDLGGFIDHGWLWRIDAKPDVIAILVSGLALEPVDAVPPRFWRMPPYYWPRSMPAGAEAFQSTEFPAESRGPDGNHCFLLHDKSQDRAFVWFKSNF